MESIGIKHTNLQFKDNWQSRLDNALLKLDQLSPKEKNKVVSVLALTVSNDDQLVTEEHEILRAVCSLIHVPLPIMQKASIN